MICEWRLECDGSGVVRCECDCDHCQEDVEHREDCVGCDNCDDGEEEDDTARLLRPDTCIHHFVRSVSPGFDVCMNCLVGRKASA